MDRRSFLKNSALGGAAVAASSTLAAPAYAQGKRTLTMVTSWPHGFAVLDDAAVHFADTVTAMSDGAITIDKKAPGELVGALEVFDAVSSVKQICITRLITIILGSTQVSPTSQAFRSVLPPKSRPTGTSMVAVRNCMTSLVKSLV